MNNYYQHKDKVVEADKRFEHVMALTLNQKTNYSDGVIRCVLKREGDVAVKGFLDRSELYYVTKNSERKLIIGGRLLIKDEEKIISGLTNSDHDFIGLEDPDIFVDNEGLIHLYFTIPLLGDKNKKIKTFIYLGHAIGKDLQSLQMTAPVLTADKDGYGAKELSIAPPNKQGVRNNLVESSLLVDDVWYSTVRIAMAEEMGKLWQFGETVFHPAEHKISWIGGHASPGPLFPKNFIDVGEGKLLGIINGREANKKVGDETLYGIFSVGLFIYDFEKGKIDWVSPESFIRDSEARTITFASQFISTGNGTGILYAHVDDSFIRAYDLNAEEIKKLLPEII